MAIYDDRERAARHAVWSGWLTLAVVCVLIALAVFVVGRKTPDGLAYGEAVSPAPPTPTLTQTVPARPTAPK